MCLRFNFASKAILLSSVIYYKHCAVCRYFVMIDITWSLLAMLPAKLTGMARPTPTSLYRKDDIWNSLWPRKKWKIEQNYFSAPGIRSLCYPWVSSPKPLGRRIVSWHIFRVKKFGQIHWRKDEELRKNVLPNLEPCGGPLPSAKTSQASGKLPRCTKNLYTPWMKNMKNSFEKFLLWKANFTYLTLKQSQFAWTGRKHWDLHQSGSGLICDEKKHHTCYHICKIMVFF